MSIFNKMQRLGKALMLPIAILPIAAILDRLGGDLLKINFIQASGSTLINPNNLTHLFAVGVGIGLAKGNAGAAGLASLAANFILIAGARSINSNIDMGVLSGFISGFIGSSMYNKYHTRELPESFGFFGKEKFAAIMTIIYSVFLSGLFGVMWPNIQGIIDSIGITAANSNSMGPFVFGFLNRLLIPIGLHQVINSIFFHQLGTFVTSTGEVITGDYFRFLAGDPLAGKYLAGFYPVMMFGLPGACLAMYLSAKKENRKKVAGLLLTISLTSFLTGITEPLEFSFMFIAPLLYFIHAILTGFSLAMTNYMGVLHGFAFSGGFIDFITNSSKATNASSIILIGFFFFLLYFIIFYFTINKLNLKTPGREFVKVEEKKENEDEKKDDIVSLTPKIVLALGGRQNIISTDACITRLRLELINRDLVDINELKKLGSKGVIKSGKTSIQVIYGSKAKDIAKSIKNLQEKSRF